MQTNLIHLIIVTMSLLVSRPSTYLVLVKLMALGWDFMIYSTKIISFHRFENYLKGCLFGEASDVISSIQYSEENYSIIWKLLIERYDRKLFGENHIE